MKILNRIGAMGMIRQIISCLLIFAFCQNVEAQNLQEDLSKLNQKLDSMGSYGIDIATKVYRNGKVIESEVMEFNMQELTYRMNTKYANTYYDAHYQLVEDKMNQVYYLGKNDSAVIKQGFSGNVADSFYSQVKHFSFTQNDSVKIYGVRMKEAGEMDSALYFINKSTGLITKMETWVADGEERMVGSKNVNTNKKVKMVIYYSYKPFKKGKTIHSLISINGEQAKLKNAKGWDLINMIPIQNQVEKQKGGKRGQ